MPGTPAKFKVEWTKQGSGSYSVAGKTYDEMFAFFQKKNSSGEEWAKFSHEKPSLSFKPTNKDPITEVTLKVGYTITMPNWPGLNGASKKGKDAWNKMIKALEKHEDHHRAILEEQSDAFGKLVSKENDLTQKKLAQLFKDFPKDVKKAQDDYDTKTAHGEKEGVFLPAPDKVQGD